MTSLICWGDGCMPALCCYARTPPPKLSWCFGDGGSIDEIGAHAAACCAPFTYENSEVPSVRGAPLLLGKSSASNLSVHIFLQAFLQDRFAVLRLLESSDRFWPAERNSTVFLAVDDGIARDRLKSIFIPSIDRGFSVVESTYCSGRQASKRYKEKLLQ
jgi:hypothetical protein